MTRNEALLVLAEEIDKICTEDDITTDYIAFIALRCMEQMGMTAEWEKE